MGVVPWHLQLVSGRETKEIYSASKLFIQCLAPSWYLLLEVAE